MKTAKLCLLAALLVVCGVSLTACGTFRPKAMSDQTLSVCGDCGELKGSDACCDESAEICRDCGLHKDSPGCCIIEKGRGDRPLCDDCGQIKDARGCCDPTAKRCPDCGKIKHSPGCCK